MPKGFSIHLGLNAVDPKGYGGWDGQLRACEADAQDMAKIAKDRGYAGTTLLLTKNATAAAFAKAMAGRRQEARGRRHPVPELFRPWRPGARP